MEADEYEQSKNYDKMINWEARIQRELPILEAFLPKGKIVDLACATGRHSFKLEEKGYDCLGIDVSEAMITLAQEIAEKNGFQTKFLKEDLTIPGLRNRLISSNIEIPFDGAILLGNAIANMGSLNAATNLIENVRSILKTGGVFVMHTINRPEIPHYIPLRKLNDKTIVQRIMIPVYYQIHNVELNVNLIEVDSLEYLRQSSTPLYMFSKNELAELLSRSGFKIIKTFGGFNQEMPSEEGGSSLVWIVRAV